MRFLPPAALRELDGRALEDLRGRTELVVAFGAGEVSGDAAAALLFAGYAVLDRDALLLIDTPAAWAGVVWRIGRRAMRLFVRDEHRFSASEAMDEELCDEVASGDPQEWLERWIGGRSELALDSAAALIRMRGGDALERAEFARLFAIGEPQRGLSAFLGKRAAGFRGMKDEG
jgi:hypothetical protein